MPELVNMSPAPGVITLLLFFVFLGIAFMLDKYFSTSSVDPDVAEVHRQLLGCVQSCLQMVPESLESRPPLLLPETARLATFWRETAGAAYGKRSQLCQQ